AAIALVAGGAAPADAAPACSAARPQPLVPRDPALCARLLPSVQHPGAPEYIDNLSGYQEKLGEFLRNFCHRDSKSGWKRDKGVRDTGPFTATFDGISWSGRPNGTHAPVVVWYSPEMIAWLHANRP